MILYYSKKDVITLVEFKHCCMEIALNQTDLKCQRNSVLATRRCSY